MIKILINGATGKMGRAMSAGIAQQDDLQIVAATDIKLAGVDLGSLCGIDPLGVEIEDDLAKAIEKHQPEVMVDFTNAQALVKNLPIALSHKVACVVGTTGLSDAEVEALGQISEQNNTPLFIASNFAIGAVLMMQFAKQAVRYFPNVEVIERHHDQKLDAPSGTAVTTLEMMAQERAVMMQGMPGEFEKIVGSRGGEYQGMRVHSVRLPGYVASQEVVFGGVGQRLVITHDTINRDSFLPGVLLAVRKVLSLHGLVRNLENIM